MAMAASHMGSMFNGPWSPSDIALVKSLIVSHNNYYKADDGFGMMNNKHKNIVDILHAQFPWKDRNEVTDLYVDIVVEMIQNEEKMGTAEPTMVGIDLVNDNFGMPVEDPSMDNMDVMLVDPSMDNMDVMLDDPRMDNMDVLFPPVNVVDTRSRKVVEKQPSTSLPPAHQPERRTGRFWSTEEHRQFLRGLSVYGRGDWKNISRHFVKTRTPVQVSSHAQKYFRRLESAPTRQRYSINDVGLYDAEPWAAPNNSSTWEALAFDDGGYNSNGYDITHGQGSTQHNVTMNNLVQQVWSPLTYHVGEASTSQEALSGDQYMGYSLGASLLAMEGTGTFDLGEQQNASTSQNWMNNIYY